MEPTGAQRPFRSGGRPGRRRRSPRPGAWPHPDVDVRAGLRPRRRPVRPGWNRPGHRDPSDLEPDQAGGGDHPGLAHGPTQTLTFEPGFDQDVGRSGQDGTDRGTETLQIWSPTRPAAAITPAWRMAPPRR